MVAVPVLVVSGPDMLIPAMAVTAIINTPQSLFSGDAMGRHDTLYAAVGIPRAGVVAGRYETCLLLLVALTIAGTIVAAADALVLGVALDWTTVAALAAGSIALTGILLAAELPAFFATGPGPVRIIAAILPSIILALLLLGWAVSDVRAALLSWFVGVDVVWLALAAIAILWVVVATSTVMSVRLYARGDL